jgi:tRNA threonylcarbamoyladenosine biosynthesis protein TsaB
LILAIETSGETASAALVTFNKVLAELSFSNKKTHSETLMPMVDFMLKTVQIPLEEVSYIALSAGPGSFTGLRIGAAVAKALSHGAQKKLIPVPTLDALSYNIFDVSDNRLVIPVMDARRNQVYTCIYDGLEKLFPYMTEDLDALLKIADGLGKEVVFLGDGSNAFYDKILSYSNKFRIAAEHNRLQRASSVGLLAQKRIDEAVSCEVNPVIYLRKPQAEREYDDRNCENGNMPLR